ncbi:MAG: hypothetical protein IJF92_00325 [Bacilli bacterium]|nr:hypothetical protein [Bacilli bacterium]MBQ3307567.1 hypothetical protein [Bacilli bacterium]
MQDLEYLKTEHNSIILDRDELIKTLNLVSRIAHINSASIECNSLSFIPDWLHRTLTLSITNDLTYFKNKIELIGEDTHKLEDIFSIKIETLNKLKPYFREKILIYKKDSEFYIRLMDGDLLLTTKIPNMTKLAFTTSIENLIFESKVNTFSKLLQSYKNMSDDYSDKWLSFDGEKISLCGLNFYAETIFKSPIMCLLMTDVDLLIRLEQYYSEDIIQIFSTSSQIPKLQIKVGNIEIELLNVLSNINRNNIEKLSAFISTSTYSVPAEAFRRIMNIALTLNDMNKDCLIKVKNDNIVIILNDSKGASEFNLMTQKLERSIRK